MARNFRRKHAAHPIADLNVTNLIDLGFMLLIIFMVATPLIQQEQKVSVELPIESASKQATLDKNQRMETITVQAELNHRRFGFRGHAFELGNQLAN